MPDSSLTDTPLLDGLNPSQRRSRRGDRRPSACCGRSWFRQNAGADLSDSPPDQGSQGLTFRRAGHHLHQQGRGRDAERVADLVGPVANDMWVSTFHSACSPDPPQRGSASRISLRLLDLRQCRLAAARHAVRARPRPRPEAIPAAQHPRRDQQSQERAHRLRVISAKAERVSITRRRATSTGSISSDGRGLRDGLR